MHETAASPKHRAKGRGLLILLCLVSFAVTFLSYLWAEVAQTLDVELGESFTFWNEESIYGKWT